jgi:MinD superfamily P-loop ATPase
VTVYSDKCPGLNVCPGKGICITVCALNAIEKVDDQPFIIEEICKSCGLCIMNCPYEALSK